MADPTSLTSSAKVLAFNSSATNSILLGYIITWIDAWIQKYCNQVFIPDTYEDEEYDGDNSNSLFLKHYPIISIDSIVINGSTLDTTAYTDTDISGVYHERGLIKRIDGGFFSFGYQNIKITYKAGLATIPSDLEMVASMMSSDIYNESSASGKGGGKISSERIGNYSVTYESLEKGEVPAKYKIILDKYKRIV